MTTVYFVRHAQSSYDNHDERSRELTAKGLADSLLVTRFLDDKGVDLVFSSPYRRAVDTVRDFAQSRGLEIRLEEDFRERRIDDGWIDDFDAFAKRQWADFDYRLENGEALRQVQARNVAALERILREHEGKTIAIGTHGMALSTIINRYNSGFGYEDFQRIRGLMPWIVRFSFEGTACRGIEEYNLFE